MKKYTLFILLMFCSIINVFALDNPNYELYLKEKTNVGAIPREYTIDYNNNLSTYNGVFKASPTSYDLRDKYSIYLEDQGSFNTCYTFATMTSLEYTIYNHTAKYYDFSKMHAEYMTLTANGGTRDTYNMGGNFRQVADYLLKGEGPVLTDSVAYKEYTDSEVSSWNDFPVLADVINIKEFPTIDKYDKVYTTDALKTFRDSVKDHLINEGPLFAVIYASSDTIKQSLNLNSNGSYDYVLNYQKGTNTYASNHAITIIGWDDNYPKENFPDSMRPTSNGAYLIQNSWGSIMPYIWVSYEDLWIEYEISGFKYEDIKPNVSYTNTSNKIYYSEGFYTSDYLNYYYNTGTDYTSTNHTIYLGNKYTKDINKSESIKEILFPFFIYNSDVLANAKVYINASDDSFNNLTYVGMINSTDSTGVYKIVLDSPIKLTGSSYSVVIEMNSMFTFSNKDTTSTYISNSLNGTYQEMKYLLDPTSNSSFPMIIRKSQDTIYELTSEDLVHSNQIEINSDALLRLKIKTNQISNSKLNILVTKDGVDKTNNFTYQGLEFDNLESILRIKPNNNIDLGNYLIKVTYEDSRPLYFELSIDNIIHDIYPNLYTSTYEIGSLYIKDIKPNTLLNDYKNNLILNSVYQMHIYQNNNEINDGIIGTGSIIKYYDGSNNLIEEYTNIVMGDLTGSGKCDLASLAKMYNYYRGKINMSGIYLKAADVNGDNSIGLADLAKIYNYYRGKIKAM